MKICFVPIDNRPVCYNLIRDTVSVDSDIDVFIPPREFLGDLTKPADIASIFNWLKNCPKSDAIILSLDTIAYGGLIPSRRSKETFADIKMRLEELKNILQEKDAKIYAFSSIMRISNNNYNEEEKEYWSDYGKKIFEYSFSGGLDTFNIPDEVLQDYLSTRRRNFDINKLYLTWEEEGFFEYLVFSKDDCAERGFNVDEAKELEKLGARIKTGADEIPLSLLSRAIEKDIKVFVEYLEPDYKNLISNYEDVSIENSVLGQLELGGFRLVSNKKEADIILLVNNFKEKQGELVMKWPTVGKYEGPFLAPNKPYIVADVRYANGADNDLIEQLLQKINIENFYGYAGWNTSANTLGSLLALAKVRFKANKYSEEAFKKAQLVRFLDDWAYQANIRGQIEKTCSISELMKSYEEKILKVLNYKNTGKIKYAYPWNRKFEIEIIFD